MISFVDTLESTARRDRLETPAPRALALNLAAISRSYRELGGRQDEAEIFPAFPTPAPSLAKRLEDSSRSTPPGATRADDDHVRAASDVVSEFVPERAIPPAIDAAPVTSEPEAVETHEASLDDLFGELLENVDGEIDATPPTETPASPSDDRGEETAAYLPEAESAIAAEAMVDADSLESSPPAAFDLDAAEESLGGETDSDATGAPPIAPTHTTSLEADQDTSTPSEIDLVFADLIGQARAASPDGPTPASAAPEELPAEAPPPAVPQQDSLDRLFEEVLGPAPTQAPVEPEPDPPESAPEPSPALWAGGAPPPCSTLEPPDLEESPPMPVSPVETPADSPSPGPPEFEPQSESATGSGPDSLDAIFEEIVSTSGSGKPHEPGRPVASARPPESRATEAPADAGADLLLDEIFEATIRETSPGPDPAAADSPLAEVEKPAPSSDEASSEPAAARTDDILGEIFDSIASSQPTAPALPQPPPPMGGAPDRTDDPVASEIPRSPAAAAEVPARPEQPPIAKVGPAASDGDILVEDIDKLLAGFRRSTPESTRPDPVAPDVLEEAFSRTAVEDPAKAARATSSGDDPFTRRTSVDDILDELLGQEGAAASAPADDVGLLPTLVTGDETAPSPGPEPRASAFDPGRGALTRTITIDSSSPEPARSNPPKTAERTASTRGTGGSAPPAAVRSFDDEVERFQQRLAKSPPRRARPAGPAGDEGVVADETQALRGAFSRPRKKPKAGLWRLFGK